MTRPQRSVPADIKVVVSDSATLRGPAHKSFSDAITHYAEALLDEMSLQEWQHRDGASVEAAYTARHVANAVKVVGIRSGMSRTRIPLYGLARVTAGAATLLSGGAFGLMNLSAWWAAPACLLLLVAVASTAYLETSEMWRRS